MKKNNQLKILVIDDDEDDFFIICDYLKGFTTYDLTINWCHSFDDGYTKISNREYDIYLIDYRLSIKTGLDLITKAVKAGCDEPMILLTGKGNSDIDMGAMKAGAIDYLVKSELSTEKLERTIRYAIERTSSIKLIREKERRFRSIFENSTDTIFIADAVGNIKQINTAGSNLLQLPKHELLHKNIFDFLSDTNMVANLFSKTLTIQNEIKDIDVTIITNQGINKNCLLSISLEADDYKHAYLQGMIHDITERKRIENNAIQVEKLAAAGRFMRTLAHEVRNPLNNINLSVEQLQHDNQGNEDAKMFLEIIQRNSTRINSLITELLQSLKESPTEKTDTCLNIVIHEVMNITKDKAALKNIELRFTNDSTDDSILADKNKLTLAFLNLVNNSIEAMGDKKGTIIFEITNVGKKILLKIIDNGSGMSEENRRRLFEPYYTTKRNGMGLGMVSTLNILQSHNASITVESSLGNGTKCFILFN